MDFGSLLNAAQKNEKMQKKEIKYYSTKFEPPKKEERSKQLSDNIKKFLARKEKEDKIAREEAKLRKDELLALRSQDKKATRRVSVMLKRTKSANKSVIQDAVDNDNTAVTLAGPSQPDEDDYGYVSQEASALYNKMMAKYSSMPDEPKFPTSKSSANMNISGTKDRVRAALLREQEEALLPHKRKRKHKDSDSLNNNVESDYSERCSDRAAERSYETKESRPKPSKPAPPPINFSDLLKLAEKKQFEPIKIEPKKEVKEEHPMTKRQKKEFEREREWRERKEKGLTSTSAPKPNPQKSDKAAMPPPNKIPKLNTPSSSSGSVSTSSSSNRIPKVEDKNRIPRAPDDRNKALKPAEDRNRLPRMPDDRNRILQRSNGASAPAKRPSDPAAERRPDPNRPMKRPDGERREPLNKAVRPAPDKNRERPQNGKPLPKSANVIASRNVKDDIRIRETNSKDVKSKPTPNDVRPRPSLSENKPRLPDARAKQLQGAVRPKGAVAGADGRPRPLADGRPKQFPPPDVRPKQFPPPDVRFPPGNVKRKPPMGHKRRILDDDEEYDSEMDDFIDDGPAEGEDYSKYIKEIFGYDKSRYRYNDEEDDAMESSFSQMMKEEFISSKIGLMEDLEDMKQEALEKKRKIMMKKGRK